MKGKRRGIVLLSVIVLSFFILAGNSWSTVNLPYAKFSGAVKTTAGVGTGELTAVNIAIVQIFYIGSNGIPATVNTPGVETMIGKRMTITGASRTGDYTFSNATISIVDPSAVTPNTYFSATLSNIEFVSAGTGWALNPGLDSSIPSTLNISNISFPGNRTTHPSRFINELEATLNAAGATTSGLKMILNFVMPAGSSITGAGIASITEGILDGSPDIVITNTAPVASAGDNISILSTEKNTTVINGTGTDADIDDTLQCRWLWMEEGTVLQEWMPVGAGGECPLDLSTLSIGVGTYTLTLEVKDAQDATDTDNMFLTIDNSAPHAAPGGAGTFEINTPVYLIGDVSDYDGDKLYYEWSEGTNIFCSGNIQATAGGEPVILPDCIKSNLSLGTHTISLQVTDGINLPDRKDITVIIKDSSAPTISPVASSYIMWPPNHIMVNIAIDAYASDNSGHVTLTASVASNEPVDGLGDGDTGPNDWTTPVINQATGRIDLQLRRERSGKGTGRIYTITITAADLSGNTSTANVNISVPHDMAKKK